MRIKYIIILITQFLFFSASNAQTSVSVSGIVKDKNTKIILPYVNIVLKNQKNRLLMFTFLLQLLFSKITMLRTRDLRVMKIF